MKIPTLLGLALLITVLVVGVFLFVYNQKIISQNRVRFAPKKIQIVNISDLQVSVIWQTDVPTNGAVSFGEGRNLTQTENDARDRIGPNNFIIHFVTLKNLKPDTTYNYQIISGGVEFFDKPQSFKTAKSLTDSSGTDKQNQTKPLRGTILNTNLNPIDEALVFLAIKGAQDIVGFTGTSGNFVIPLKDIRSSDLTSFVNLNTKTDATLTINRVGLESQVQLSLPVTDKPLPPLVIGQNINLKDYLTNQANQSKPAAEKPPVSNSEKFDLNGDGKVNSLDLSVIVQNFGKNPKNKKADLNSDGKVDQDDIDLISAQMQ